MRNFNLFKKAVKSVEMLLLVLVIPLLFLVSCENDKSEEFEASSQSQAWQQGENYYYGIEIQDANFRNYLQRVMPHVLRNDRFLIFDQASRVTEITLRDGLRQWEKVSNIQELRYFTGLKKLDVSGRLTDSFRDLYLDNNLQLEELNCSGNSLVNLSIDQNTELRLLYCGNNSLSRLYVQDNPLLETLYCQNNFLSRLIVSRNYNLRHLDCNTNRITNLDLSGNPKLTELNCNNNELRSLDASPSGDNLVSLSADNNYLTYLDVSQNRNLRQLACRGNNLQTISLYNNTVLRFLSCLNNPLERLEINSEISNIVGVNQARNSYGYNKVLIPRRFSFPAYYPY